MTLSDFRTGHPPAENVGGATSTSAGYPPITQTTFLTCRAHYPGGSNRCVSVSFPVHAAFPNYLVGRHPRRHFRGLLQLHSRYGLQDCSPAEGGLLSRGFSPASYPTKPLGSYHVLPTSTWVNPPFTGDLRRWGAQILYGLAFVCLGICAAIYTVKASRESGEAAANLKLTLEQLQTATDRTETLQALNVE